MAVAAGEACAIACQLIADGLTKLDVKGLTRAIARQAARKLVTLAQPSAASSVRKLPNLTFAVRLTDAAKELGISRQSAYQWLRDGRLRHPIKKSTREPIRKINGMAVVSRESVNQCLAEMGAR